MESARPARRLDDAPALVPFGPLARVFSRLSFRLKFVLIGVLLAGPLFVLAGFTVASQGHRVQQASARVQALDDGALLRTLAASLALHRGLSAGVLSGDEALSTSIVAQQAQVQRDWDALRAAHDAATWDALGLGSVDVLGREIRALTRLPDATAPERNFERHGAVIDRLLAANARLGVGQGPADALAFVVLPALAEDLARQRGWGSAVLTLQQYSTEEQVRYLLYAGSALQRLQRLGADRRTLAELDTLLGGAGGTRLLADALAEAEIFSRRSLAAVTTRAGGTDAARDHFREGTLAIQRLAAVADTVRSRLLDDARTDRHAAERARNAAMAGLAVLVIAIALVYQAFGHSTVRRLQHLAQSSGRIARGEFERPIHAEGRDEITVLAQSLEDMRLRLRQAVADRAERLAAEASDRAKSDFIARWSHDLRTPLNAVLGFSEILEARPGAALSAEQREDLRRIREAGQHLLSLVDDVLDLALAERADVPLKREPVDLAALLTEAVNLATPPARRAGIDLALQVPPGAPPVVRGDRTRLLQVFGNLLTNAIKYNRAGGRVEVTLHDAPQHVRVAVRDTGLGIPADRLSRLFQPFERLHDDRPDLPGAGIGLASAHRLVQAMHGQIEVDSVLDQGSRFTVTLPKAGADAPLPRVAGRLAYVEDDPVNTLLLRAMLESDHTDLVVTPLRSAAAARAAAAEPFDLWLVDRHLPDGDGLDLLADLRRAAGRPLRAVMLSADAQAVSEQRALGAGYLAYWRKPLDGETLLARVSAMLAPGSGSPNGG